MKESNKESNKEEAKKETDVDSVLRRRKTCFRIKLRCS